MLKKVFSLSVSYALIEGVQKGILFLLTPIFTYHISSSGYGVVASILMLVPFLSVIFTFSLQSSLSRYYFKYCDDKDTLKRYLGTMFLGTFMMSLILALVLISVGEALFSLIIPSVSYKPYIITAIVLSSIQPIVAMYFVLVKTMQEVKKYLLLYSMYFGLQIASIVYTVVFLGMEENGYISSLLVSNIVMVVVIFFMIRNEITICFERMYFREALEYSWPIVPVDLISMLGVFVDRFFIAKFIGLSAVGIYFIGYQLALIVTMVSVAINAAFIPVLFRRYESGNGYDQSVYTLSKLIVYAMSFLALLISVLAPYIIKYLFVEEYSDAEGVVVLLSFVGALRTIYFLNTNTLSLEPELVKLKTIGVLFGAFVTVILGYIMTKSMGLYGAALSTLLGFMVTTIVLIFIVKRKTEFKFENGKYLLTVILFFGVSYFCRMIESDYLRVLLPLLIGLILVMLIEMVGKGFRVNDNIK